ncbi:ATP-binding protein [Kitasatospora sp. NPDC056327]|uniref:ATP-binding protein n=1 Tax=Kitasatospora sp. NPDC056327 TaxID=3345785 RepID=UPI0035DA0394
MSDVCNNLPPAPSPHEQSTWLPKHRRSVGVARRLLLDFLRASPPGLADLFSSTGELLLSELVTNTVQHARVPADRLLLVRFALSPAELRIEVHDAGRPLPSSVSTPQQPGLDAEAGRGLFLVDRLAHSWGCFPRPDGIGKAVWCTIAPARPQ